MNGLLLLALLSVLAQPRPIMTPTASPTPSEMPCFAKLCGEHPTEECLQKNAFWLDWCAQFDSSKEMK